MSMVIAEQLHKTIISDEVCKTCSQYSWEHVSSKYGIIGISFCKAKWFGGICEREEREDQ